MLYRVTDAEAGRLEYEINSGMERDGLHHRLCMHADRTVTETGEGRDRAAWVSCDYCPIVVVAGVGQAVPHMPPHYWRTS